MNKFGRVLVVDDEPIILKLLTAQVKRLAHHVTGAENAAKALAILRNQSFDILITDVVMPGMNGLALMDMAMRLQPELICIVVSGQADISIAVEAMKMGAINYIQKPISPFELEVSIDKGMERLALLKNLRQNQQALEKSEAQLRSLMESTQVGIFLYRGKRILFANPVLEQITGYSVQECLDLVPWAFIHPKHAKVIQQYEQARLRGESVPTRYEIRIVTKEGAIRWLDFMINMILLDGEQTCLVSCVDISERKRIEEELTRHREHLEQLVTERTAELARTNQQLREDIRARKKAEKEAEHRRRQLIEADKMVSLGILVAGVAHEVNNPNNFITMNTPILRRAWDDFLPILEQYSTSYGDFPVAGIPFSEMRGHIPELFAGIQDGSERIRKIVYNLRDYARQGASDMGQIFSLNDVIRAALVLLANPLKKATRHLKIDCDETLPSIRGNFQRAEQVIINLIQNAYQSLSNSDKGIIITTSFDQAKAEALVTVNDQGDGIPAKNLKRVLDPFFTTRRDNGGTGLGLSISAGIMEEHGGRLVFSSNAEGGTTARAIFPTCSLNPHQKEPAEHDDRTKPVKKSSPINIR